MKVDDAVQKSVEKLREVFGHPGLDDERKKLEQKIGQAKYSPGSVRVWADCVLAILLAARSQGFQPQAVLDELEKLAKESLSKKWKKMPDGTFQAFD
jgi:hypothetical protein